jgi:hypothetical protein
LVGKLLPVLLALIGLAGGAGAGFMLKPAPPEAEAECDPKTADCEAEKALEEAAEPVEVDEGKSYEYVKFPKQFVVPVMGDSKIKSIVVTNLSVEVETGNTDGVISRRPKLRAAFLQVLFEHAYAGGFDGVFTKTQVMSDLRGRLRETAKKLTGNIATDVLITEIVRQDY